MVPCFMFEFHIEASLGILHRSNKMFTKLSSILSTLTTTGSPRDFPYTLNTENEEVLSIWYCSTATRNSDGQKVAVLSCSLTDKIDVELRAVQIAHTKLKTMRHPNILKYLDSHETPKKLNIVIEEAVSLKKALLEHKSCTFFMKYGILQLLRGLDFLNNQCKIVHGNVSLTSVFVDSALEWKLAGLEYSHGVDEQPPPKPPGLSKYDPPEMTKGIPKKSPIYSTDMWGLGVLIYELYNGELQNTSDLRNTRKIPKDLVPHYCTLVSANPNSRPNPKDLLEEMRSHGSYLSDPMISIALGIEELHVMEAAQRKTFLETLNKHLEQFPKPFCTQKVLTSLLNTFEFSNAGTTILEPLFKIAQYLEDKEYQAKIVPCVVKLFSSTDRATRIQLLQKMNRYVEHIRTSTASNDIFPSVALGFTDTVQAVREETVKSMVLLAPKLNGNILNNQLLKYLAKSQMDQVPTIRTNTTIVISKIASQLDKNTQQRVLSSAFLRGIRDPFIPAKMAALGGLCATSSLYTPSEMATKIIPAVSVVLIDPNKEVRERGFTTIQVFVKELQKHSDCMKDSTEHDQSASSTTWSWAQSLTSALYKGGSGTKEGGTRSESDSKPNIEKTGESQKDHDKPSDIIDTRGGIVGSDRGRDDHQLTQHQPTQDENNTGEGWGDDNDDEWESLEQEVTKVPQSVNTSNVGDSEDWGEWGEDLDLPQPTAAMKSKHQYSQKKDPVPLFTMKEDTSTKIGSSSSGWDEGWSDDWSDPFSSVSTSKPQSQSREVDTRQQRQEERRQRQEAARQKRASGHSSKPKLGAKSD